MADDFNRSKTLVLIALVPCLLIDVCRSCSMPDGWRPPTLVDRILRARRILYGRVTNTYDDKRYGSSSMHRVYSVELEVYCILKGDKTPLVVNISGAGYIPGHCTGSKFDVHRNYVIISHDSESHSATIDGPEINANATILNEITKACDLNPVTRPEGSTSKVECPVSAIDCLSKPEASRDDNREDPDIDYEYSIYEDTENETKAKKIPGHFPNSSSTTLVSALLVAVVLTLHVITINF